MTKILSFLGDSITAGGDWDTLLNRTGCQNFGVPGDHTYDMLARIADVYTASPKPEICFILGGKNDVEQSEFIATQSGHNLIDICGILRSHDILPALIAPFKVGVAANNYQVLNTRLQAITDYLNSSDYGAPANMIDYMDLNTIWMAPTGVLKAEFTDDGTHLTTGTGSGYGKLAELLNYWLTQHGY